VGPIPRYGQWQNAPPPPSICILQPPLHQLRQVAIGASTPTAHRHRRRLRFEVYIKPQVLSSSLTELMLKVHHNPLSTNSSIANPSRSRSTRSNIRHLCFKKQNKYILYTLEKSSSQGREAGGRDRLTLVWDTAMWGNVQPSPWASGARPCDER
jgi:hypothetical protein